MNLPRDRWRIDYQSPNSFRNWVDPDKLDLTCTDSSLIGLMGSAYFLGFAISSGIVPRISDIMGRKWPYISSLIFQTIAYLLIILSTNLYGTIAYYLMVGLAAGGRVSIGTMWLSEFIPLKYQSTIVTMINCGDASVMIFQSIYYIFIKDWRYLHYFGFGWAILITLVVFTLPESPKYYYAKKDYENARNSLEHIAKFNRSKYNVNHIVFDTESSQNTNSNTASITDTPLLNKPGEEKLVLTGQMKEVF